MPPKFKDLERNCEKDNWELNRNTDHFYDRKTLDDGRILQKKVSHAVHKEIPKGLWERILKKQLCLDSEEAFWGKVKR